MLSAPSGKRSNNRDESRPKKTIREKDASYLRLPPLQGFRNLIVTFSSSSSSPWYYSFLFFPFSLVSSWITIPVSSSRIRKAYRAHFFSLAIGRFPFPYSPLVGAEGPCAKVCGFGMNSQCHIHSQLTVCKDIGSQGKELGLFFRWLDLTGFEDWFTHGQTISMPQGHSLWNRRGDRDRIQPYDLHFHPLWCQPSRGNQTPSGSAFQDPFLLFFLLAFFYIFQVEFATNQAYGSSHSRKGSNYTQWWKDENPQARFFLLAFTKSFLCSNWNFRLTALFFSREKRRE